MKALLPAFFLVACTGAGSSKPAAEFGCGGPNDLCQVEGGQYLAMLPDDWDGEELLPTFIHFHGYGGTAVALYEKGSFTDPMGPIRALAIYPDGQNKTWAHTGSPSSARDELAYFDALFADVKSRFPVDPDRLIISGFSQGGSMAWDVACYRGASTGAVFAPVSGSFWEALPTECPAGPIRLRHEHGERDTVIPLQGRSIGSYQQGDTRESIAVMVASNGCIGEPAVVEEDGRTCQVWTSCAEGGEVQLCLHPGDHRVTSGWHRRALDWASKETP